MSQWSNGLAEQPHFDDGCGDWEYMACKYKRRDQEKQSLHFLNFSVDNESVS